MLARAAPIFTRLIADQLLERCTIIDPAVAAHRTEELRLREEAVAAATELRRPAAGGHHHHGGGRSASTPLLEPQPTLDAIRSELSRRFGASVILWQIGRDELAGFGGELDTAVQMPGWTNVWTMPIQNRVDMLSTGVNTPIGVRVLGQNLEDVVRGAEEVARVIKGVPGAVDVLADPIRGKPYIEVRPDRERAARLGVRAGEINDLIETALAGRWSSRRRSKGGSATRWSSGIRGPAARTRSPCATCSSRPTGKARDRVHPRRARAPCRSPRSPMSGSSRARRRSRERTDSCAATFA